MIGSRCYGKNRHNNNGHSTEYSGEDHNEHVQRQSGTQAYVHGTYRRTETSTTWNTGRSFIGSSATAKMQQGDCLRYEDGASLLRQV